MSASIGTIIEDEQEFLDDVEAFYKDRGVPWERDAKVAGRPVSLHQLFKTVMEIGGYDKISAERMRWRTLVHPFGLGTTHEPAMTFQLKTVYYKNLAAYEIARYWGEEPPPREILEDLTAKGGDLRNRRIETYPMSSRNLDGRDSEDEELQKTPVKENKEFEEPGSGRRYPTRELRQDPKRTQLYQPDPTPSRTRNSRTTGSPQPLPAMSLSYHNTSTDPRNPSFSIDKYEPRQPIALTLRPVLTPGNSADVFYQRKAMEKVKQMPRLAPDTKFLDQLKHVVPYNIRQGSGIYARCHMGLQSGIKEEQSFALHHLVKVSFERGDKFTFKGFPNLAEALIEKALEISTLIYGIKWDLVYDQPEGVSTPYTLNAAYGTPNLLEHLKSFQPIVEDGEPELDEDADQLTQINHAVLVLRNMITLEENASFIAKNPTFKDLLVIATSLPQYSSLTEIRQYALEMAEFTTRYWPMTSDDPLYQTLVVELESTDRSRTLSALRAIVLIGLERSEPFRIADIPQSTIERVVALIMLDDDDLIEAAMEFLYAYTANSENVTHSLQDASNPSLLPSIVPRITSLLLHNASPYEDKINAVPFHRGSQITTTIPIIPNDLYAQLLQYPEPERSSRWLRCCFEESPQEDITQIAIWQAYQSRFAQTNIIQAADFIKNVSTTFHSAQAQVINGPQPRFIIKGIKPRRILVDSQGRSFFKCLWEVSRPDAQVVYDGQGRQRHICGTWHSTRVNVWNHIVHDHCGIQRGSDGRFQNNNPASNSNSTNAAAVSNGTTNESGPNGTSSNTQATTTSTSIPARVYKCSYLSCSRASGRPFVNAAELGIHIRGHIPETTDAMAKIINDIATIPEPGQVGMPRQREPTKDEMYVRHILYYTATDERNNPCGIPFMAVMILRNLARFVGQHGGRVTYKPFTFTDSTTSNGGGSLSPTMRRKDKKDLETRQKLMGRFFSPNTRADLFHVLSVHRTLITYLGDLIALINKGEADDKKRNRDEDIDLDLENINNTNIGITATTTNTVTIGGGGGGGGGDGVVLNNGSHNSPIDTIMT